MADIQRVGRMRKRCVAQFSLGADYLLRCKESDGHSGMHFADVTINGIASETGWRDDESHGYFDIPLPARVPGETETA